MTKYILVSGGVISGIGKGVIGQFQVHSSDTLALPVRALNYVT